MLEVVVREEIGASADTVWRMIRDFGETVLPGGIIDRCTVEGRGEGAVRTLQVGRVAIQERLESRDDANRRLSYTAIGDNPLPVRDYLSVMTVSEGGPDRCTLEWKGAFTPLVEETQARSVIVGLYLTGISGLKKHLGL